MDFREFAQLLTGLNGDTPLGNVVRIRSETDPKRIKDFSPAERLIRDRWREKHAKAPSLAVQKSNAAALVGAFKQIARNN